MPNFCGAAAAGNAAASDSATSNRTTGASSDGLSFGTRSDADVWEVQVLADRRSCEGVLRRMRSRDPPACNITI